MRSARAVISNGPAGASTLELAAHLALQHLNAGAARGLACGEPLCEAGEARPPERRVFEVEAQLLRRFIQLAQQLRCGVFRQRLRVCLEEAMQGGVIEDAFVARVAGLIEAAQRVEAENVARIDGVRVGEPGLDGGDAQAARARVASGGRGRGRQAGSILSGVRCAADPIEPRAVGLQRIQLACSGRQRLDPRDPAARPGEAAILFLGPREDDARRRSGKRHEIVRHLADAALGGRQAHEFAVVAAEPGVRARHLRPAAFIQPGQHYHIRRKQARIERFPKVDARMRVFGCLCRASPKSPAQKTPHTP